MGELRNLGETIETEVKEIVNDYISELSPEDLQGEPFTKIALNLYRTVNDYLGSLIGDSTPYEEAREVLRYADKAHKIAGYLLCKWVTESRKN